MNKLLRYALQGVNYAVFMALIGYFSTAPAVRQLGENEAVVTLAFAHRGQPVEPCRQLSPEELVKLPPNMRLASDCPRERSPVVVEVLMDGRLLFREQADPPGLFKDGGVDIFRSAKVPAGTHLFEIRMNDSVRVEGFNYTHQEEVTLEPARHLVIDFKPEQGFILK